MEEEVPPLPSHRGIAWSAPEAGEIEDVQRDYQIIELIGRGGMGAVYRAWQPSLGRLVAVKVLSSGTGMMGAQERFENEARVLGLLQHPNIMPIHDLGKDAEGRSFYAMKLVKGRTLQQILHDLGKGDPAVVRQYPLAALLTVFEKICDALSFAHSQHVLHRDLKPDNIMVGEFGEVLVLDWGLAKVLVNDEGRITKDEGGAAHPAYDIRHSTFTDTLDGDVLGTPQFMSPEQAEGKTADLDARSDVFSLGGVLYAILTLHAPVEGEDVKSVLQRVREGAITPPVMRTTEATRVRAGAAKGNMRPAKTTAADLPHCPGGRVPASLSAVAMKALQVDLTQRYQTVAELQAEVVAYQRGFATSAEEASAWRLLQLFMLRHKAASVALLALGLFSAGFVIKLVQSERAAQQSAIEANAARIVAQEKGEAARQALAGSRLSLAAAGYRANDSPAMLQELNLVPEDLRGLDWKYLRQRADNSVHAFTDADGSSLMGAAPHPMRAGVFATVASSTGGFVFVNAGTGQRVGGFSCTQQQQGTRYNCHPLAFSPDARLLASGRLGDGSVAVYDVASGRPVGTWPKVSVTGVCFSPDGSQLLVVTESSQLLAHDPATGAQAWTKPNVGRAIYLPSGNIIAAFGGRVILVDGKTGADIRKIVSLGTRAHSFAVSSDGMRLYVGGDEGWVRAYQVADGTELFAQPLTNESMPVHVVLSSDGKRLLASADRESGGRIVRMLDAETGRLLQNLMGGRGRISGVGLHPLSGDVLVSGPTTRSWTGASLLAVDRSTFGSPMYSCFWGAEGDFLSLSRVLKLGPPDEVFKMPLPPAKLDGGWWHVHAAGNMAGFAIRQSGDQSTPSQLYTVRREGYTFTQAATAATRERAHGLRLNPSGTRMVTTNGERILEVFDTGTGRRLCQCDVADLKIDSVFTWINDREFAAIAFDERHDLLVWNAETGRVVRRTTHPTRMQALAISPDGQTLAEAGDDQRVRLRDVTTLAVKQEFRVHDAAVTALAFHPRQPLLATASNDRSVRLWTLPSGTLTQEIEPSRAAVVSLEFSADGKVLACADHAHFFHFVKVLKGE